MSASVLKEEGNSALKEGRTAQAVDIYSRAIALEPRNHVLYSNRAAALAALGRYDDALNDSSQVIVLEPTWVKVSDGCDLEGEAAWPLAPLCALAHVRVA